ncbi:MAG TPA: DUF2116 family Zn-ribbon domain-containing protein [Candidatus Thermoplasmatota archaeon]|jgi:predicted nucleic acid-binding Zn ribbon protein|nr:DUF2116 family Zn-ribbon domain-containing protein [Candidatus Thermoplasmatota archaeon]
MSSNIVVNHQHCYICNRAMTFGDEKWCSDECKAKLDEQNKRRKRMMYFLYAAMGLTLILLFYGSVPR